MANDYRIGTTSSMTLLSGLTIPLEWPKSNYFPYAKVLGLGNGGSRGIGKPFAIWTFGVLTPEQRNQLKTFCTGASATVWIRTKLQDDTFDDLTGKMVWPVAEERKWGLKFGLTIEFRNLVAF